MLRNSLITIAVVASILVFVFFLNSDGQDTRKIEGGTQDSEESELTLTNDGLARRIGSEPFKEQAAPPKDLIAKPAISGSDAPLARPTDDTSEITTTYKTMADSSKPLSDVPELPGTVSWDPTRREHTVNTGFLMLSVVVADDEESVVTHFTGKLLGMGGIHESNLKNNAAMRKDLDAVRSAWKLHASVAKKVEWLASAKQSGGAIGIDNEKIPALFKQAVGISRQSLRDVQHLEGAFLRKYGKR